MSAWCCEASPATKATAEAAAGQPWFTGCNQALFKSQPWQQWHSQYLLASPRSPQRP
eukprot:SM003144S11981  [mRNA]  locus=s3144:330:500:- [translate_table: standard]